LKKETKKIKANRSQEEKVRVDVFSASTRVRPTDISFYLHA